MKQVEHFLAQSSEHMAQALSHSRVTITCQDLELNYLWVFNPAKEFEDIIGQKLSDLTTKEQHEPVDALKREVLKTQKPVQKVLEVPFRDEQHTYDLTVTPTFHGGELVGVTTVAVDLTDLLAAQEDLHKANARLLGLLGDAVQQGKTVIRSV